MRRAGSVAFLIAAAAFGVGDADADAAGAPALHGIALGMTGSQARAAAHLPCFTTIAGNLRCRDPRNGSTYDVGLSGGTPSRALRIVHTFCSSAPPAAVLNSFAGRFGTAPGAVMGDPNGSFFDIGPNDEGVLDLRRGTCRDGRKRFQVSIRDDALIVFSLKQAQRRRKAARR